MQSHFAQARFSRRNFLTTSALFGVGTITASLRGSQQPASAGAADPALIEDLVAAYRILAQHEVLDGFGHVSSRHNRSANRFIMSRSLAPELVTPDDLMNSISTAMRWMLEAERHIRSDLFMPKFIVRGPTSKPWSTLTRRL